MSTPPVDPLDREEESPDVPGFRTWRGVYWLVLAWFILVVGLLTLFSVVFS